MYNHWKAATRLGLSWTLFGVTALCAALYGPISLQVGLCVIVSVFTMRAAIGFSSSKFNDPALDYVVATLITLIFGVLPGMLGYPGVIGMMILYGLITLLLFGAAIYWRRRHRREGRSV